MAGVTSEIGRLRTVILHRPGVEVARLIPEITAELLFDDLLYLDKAQEEHDRFAEVLHSRGVEVLYFADLLRDVIDTPPGRRQVVEGIMTPHVLGPAVAGALRSRLLDEDTSILLDVLVGGILWEELEAMGVDPPLSVEGWYALKPIPNLLFMRDSAVWIDDAVALAVPAKPARKPEAVFLDAIYRHHARFGDPDRWFGASEGDGEPASLEGGDVLLLAPGTVMIGVSERTTAAAAETLASRLFAADAASAAIVARLPRRRATMHLDTVFTMVDRSKFNVFPGIVDELTVDVLRPEGDQLKVDRDVPVVRALEETLGLTDPLLIPTGGDAIGRLREQWDDGNNTLALAPGVVVAYRRNRETNVRLRAAGVEVLEIEAAELCRGRGGSRCMSQPVHRDSL